jgi:hypothetical protein
MKRFTLLLATLMIFSLMARSQYKDSDIKNILLNPTSIVDFIDMDSVWCDFEGFYTNTGGFREAINSNTIATDVPGAGVKESTIIELEYNVSPDVITTGYQMWAYPDMIDVSQYNYFVLNIKAEAAIENVHLILMDNVNLHAEGNSQLPFNIGTEWEQIFLPLDSFKVQTGSTIPADLTILHLIQVLFINDVVSESAGIVYIDEVGFTTEAVNLSTKEVENIGVSVYPNPASDYINVSAKAGSLIKILNVNGGIIESRISDKAITGFSVSGLPKGVYLVNVVNGNVCSNHKVLIH